MFSIVFLNWARLDNLKTIVKAYQIGGVKDIIIWNNADQAVDIAGARCINAGEDFGMRSRFAAALFAENDCVLIHDDDLMLSMSSMKMLHSLWQQEPEIVHGLLGRNPDGKGNYAEDVYQGSCEMVIGRCMMFHRKYAASFFGIEQDYPSPEGHVKGGCEDILMSYHVISRTGRPNKVHFLNFQELDDNEAINQRPDHLKHRDMMMKLCRSKLLGVK